MTNRSFRLARTSFALLAVLFFAQAFTFSQSKKMSKAYGPTRNEEYVAYCALWRTDASYRSTIRLSNQLAVSEMDVIPTIYMADGTPWELTPVHLAKSGVATVDINAMIATAPPDVQAHLSTYGSASIRYRYDWQGAVYATMSILDLVRSLDYSPSFVFPPGQGGGEKQLPAKIREFRDSANGKTYEGLWFRNGHNGGGFLALANTNTAPIGVHVKLSGLRNPNPVERNFSLGKHGTALIDLKDLFGDDEARTGGITVSHTGAPGALQLVGGLEDYTTGYSSDMPLVVAKTKQGEKAERQYASVGLMVNEQDSVLGFPSGLKFWPYAFFRNVTTEIRTLHLSVNYMVGKTVKNLALPDVTLAPGEAREVVIRDIMTKEPEVADINLVFNYAGDYGDVLPATGSTDATANYVFPVRAQPVAKSGTKSSIYWLASGGFDTMYTVWNPLGISQELLATIYFGAKGETYNLPLHLEPYASAMIDIGELMSTQQPDRDGKVIPFDAQHGSLDISHATGRPEDLITAVMSGGIYNPQKATCGVTCNTCSGMTSVNFIPNPFSLSVGSSQQGALTYSIESGSQYDVSGGSHWSSGATSIATVQTTGQSNPGLTTGVSPGGTTITALYYGGIPANAGQVCGEGSWTCPTISGISGSGSAPVKPTVSITCNNLDLSLGSTAPASTVTGTCTTQVSPGGGSFAWTASGNTINLVPSNDGTSATYTATSASSKLGDTNIKVSYTYPVNTPNQTISATSSAITVHQPTTLVASSLTANGTAACTLPCLAKPGDGTCNVTSGTSCTYNANQFQREYKVYDQFNIFFQDVGINNATVTETVNLTSNNCGGSGTNTGSSVYTDFNDQFGKCDTCCEQGGPGCTTVAAQSLYVNGFSVRNTTITETCTTVSVNP